MAKFDFEQYSSNWTIDQCKHSKVFGSFHKFHAKRYQNSRILRDKQGEVFDAIVSNKNKIKFAGVNDKIEDTNYIYKALFKDKDKEFLDIGVVLVEGKQNFHNCVSIFNGSLMGWPVNQSFSYSSDLLLFIYKFKSFFQLDKNLGSFFGIKVWKRVLQFFEHVTLDMYKREDVQIEFEKLMFLMSVCFSEEFSTNSTAMAFSLCNPILNQVSALMAAVDTDTLNVLSEISVYQQLLIGAMEADWCNEEFKQDMFCAYLSCFMHLNTYCHYTYPRTNKMHSISSRAVINDLIYGFNEASQKSEYDNVLANWLVGMLQIKEFVQNSFSAKWVGYGLPCEGDDLGALIEFKLSTDNEFSLKVRQMAGAVVVKPSMESVFWKSSVAYQRSPMTVDGYIDALQNKKQECLKALFNQQTERNIVYQAEKLKSSVLFKQTNFLFDVELKQNCVNLIKAGDISLNVVVDFLDNPNWLIEQVIDVEKDLSEQSQAVAQIFCFEKTMLLGSMSKSNRNFVKVQQIQTPKGWFDLGKSFSAMSKFNAEYKTLQWVLMVYRLQKTNLTLKEWLLIREDVSRLSTLFDKRFSPWQDKFSGQGICAASLFKLIEKTGLGSIKAGTDVMAQFMRLVSNKSSEVKTIHSVMSKLCFLLKLHCNDVQAVLTHIAKYNSIAQACNPFLGCPVTKDIWKHWKDIVFCAKAGDAVFFKFIGEYEQKVVKNKPELRSFDALKKWYLSSEFDLDIEQYNELSKEDKQTIDFILKKQCGRGMFNDFFNQYSAKVQNDIQVESIETDKLVIRLLAPKDKKALYIGELSGCCQHLYSAGKACAIHSYSMPDSGVIVVENLDGSKVYAQSFVWLSADKSTLVFDSIESVHSGKDKTYLKLVVDGIEKLLDQLNEKYKVVVSDTDYGMTTHIVTELNRRRKNIHRYSSFIDRASYVAYTDFQQRQGWLLCAGPAVKVISDDITEYCVDESFALAA